MLRIPCSFASGIHNQFSTASALLPVASPAPSSLGCGYRLCMTSATDKFKSATVSISSPSDCTRGSIHPVPSNCLGPPASSDGDEACAGFSPLVVARPHAELSVGHSGSHPSAVGHSGSHPSLAPCRDIAPFNPRLCTSVPLADAVLAFHVSSTHHHSLTLPRPSPCAGHSTSSPFVSSQLHTCPTL